MVIARPPAYLGRVIAAITSSSLRLSTCLSCLGGAPRPGLLPGALTTTDEAPEFGAQVDFTAAAIESDSIATDALAGDPATTSEQRHRDPDHARAAAR